MPFARMPKESALGILGLQNPASEQDITKAYRKLALRYHPDKGGNAEDFKRIGSAKDDLMYYAENEAQSLPAQSTTPPPRPTDSRPAPPMASPPTPPMAYPMSAQKTRAQVNEEECNDVLRDIKDIFKDNLRGASSYSDEGDVFYRKNIGAIEAFAGRRTPLHHNRDGAKSYTYLSKLERLNLLLQILNTVHSSHNPYYYNQNLSYITQELLDFLLHRKTNLADIQTTFESLLESKKLNMTTIDFVINKPAYSSILASTLKHVTDTYYADTGDMSEEMLTEKANVILEFYNFFAADSMESIEFEAALLGAKTINAVDAVIEQYQVVLRSAKTRQEAEEQQQQQEDGRSDERTPASHEDIHTDTESNILRDEQMFPPANQAQESTTPEFIHYSDTKQEVLRANQIKKTKNQQLLTEEQLSSIRGILTQYQSHSWQAFFWNTMCCGVFGKHYSQTLYALQTLVGDGTTAVHVTNDQILEAIQIEPKYAAHRLSLFNKPDSEIILSGTDEVIHTIAMTLNKK